MVVPVPKRSHPKNVNDFRPVALTSVLIKIFEKSVRSEILRRTEYALDPMQFAYMPHRVVEDATVTLLNLLFRHLDGKGTHARLLFSLYTIKHHILTRRLLEQCELSNNLVGWILDFLTNRTQRVRVNGTLSDQKSSSTGSPQGCVLSPFVIYFFHKYVSEQL